MPDKAIGFSTKGITQSRLKVWLPVTLISHLFFQFLKFCFVDYCIGQIFFLANFCQIFTFFRLPLKFVLIYVLLIIVFWLDLVFICHFYVRFFFLPLNLNSFNSSIKNASKLCTFQVQELIQFSLFLDFLFFFFFWPPLKQNLSRSRSIPVGLLLVTLNSLLYKSSHF